MRLITGKYGIITPHARGKAIGFVRLFVCLFVSTKNQQIRRSRRYSNMHVSLQCREGGETYLLLPSRHLKRATSIINSMFLSATPFDHTQICHVLPQLHMLELSVGKGRQVPKLIYACRSWM